MPTQKIRVEGLKHDDEARIAERVQQLEGVYYAVLNHEDESAEIDFEDDCVSWEEICTVIAGFGYRVQLAG